MPQDTLLDEWNDGYVDGLAGIQPLLDSETYLQGWATGRHKNLKEVESALSLFIS